MKETIETRKHFFNLSETSEILGIHRNTVKNMVDDGRIKVESVGKRSMIHSTEISRIKNGKSLHGDEGLIELDMKISIKMDELNNLLEERKNYGKMSREDFLDQLKKLKVKDSDKEGK